MTVQERVSRLAGMRDQTEADFDSARVAVGAGRERVALLDQVLELLEKSGAAARDRVRAEVGGIASGAMQDIFGDEASADVEFSVGARGYSARIVTQGRGFHGDPMRTDGGSACKILAVALRAAFVHRFRKRPRVLLLDEPFSGVDAKHIHDTARWIRGLTSQLGMQILMINHEWPEVWEQVVDRELRLGGPEPEVIERGVADVDQA